MKGLIKIMYKKIITFISALSVAVSFAGCSDSSESSSVSESSASEENAEETEAEISMTEAESKEETEAPTATEAPTPEPTTAHVSPLENVTSSLGAQVTLSKTIMREDGKNTVKIPLSDFIQDGDTVSSFTFVIYSDGGSIGTFKGGCGISVTEDCSAASDEGWYQSEDFSAPTEGTYGEITWNVPAEVSSCIDAGGDVMFGYWWGDTDSIRVEEVICTYTRNAQVKCDGTAELDVNQTVGYNDADNSVKFSYKDTVPSDCVPTAITYNISSSGSLGKFTGAFGISDNSAGGWYQSGDTAVFTDSSSLSLTWIIPDSIDVKAGGDAMLGYWWSDQSAVTLDSVSIKYAYKNGASVPAATKAAASETKPAKAEKSDGSFRSSAEIVSDIKLGWNLGNTLECYNYKDYSSDAETAWGNVKTTKEMFTSVKNAGFNAVRIPVTWGEHMNGDTIDEEWMNRVQEVVDYAYSQDLYVILNMHHDDYTWFTPNEGEYSSDSAKLCKIWEQICARFGDYGDRLLFEGMNEPRTVGSDGEWTGGTAEERAVVNKYEQDFVNTVRASGGNNAQRTLIVTSYGASMENAAVDDIIVPDTENIVVNVHFYAPWDFADGQSNSWDKSVLDNGFSKLKSMFIDKNIPVIIDEFGAVANNNDSVRSEYYQYYVSKAKDTGIKCFIWDNGVYSGESAYGLFNRKDLSWNQELLSGLMNGAN